MPYKIKDIQMKTEEATNVIISKCQKTVKKQDFFQRIKTVAVIIIESYRITTCSLLLVFIPQKCGNQICSINDNLDWNTTFYSGCLILNFFTLFTFGPLYCLEIIRENVLIQYLDVNNLLPNDNNDVKKVVKLLPQQYKKKIVTIDKCYQKYSYFVICVYLLNVALSLKIILDKYIGNQTISVFFTYMIFILKKLYNICMISNTDKYIFYSAYLKGNIQYNDIDEFYKQNIRYVNPKESENTVENGDTIKNIKNIDTIENIENIEL